MDIISLNIFGLPRATQTRQGHPFEDINKFWHVSHRSVIIAILMYVGSHITINLPYYLSIGL